MNSLHKLARTIRYFIENPHLVIWNLRSMLLPGIPLPTYTDNGYWWLAYNDFLGSHVYCGFSFENEVQAFIKSFLQPGMTVLDIGAHHGFYTLMSSNLIGSQGKVYAFEPSTREYSRLSTHVKLNKSDNIELINLALSNKEENRQLHVVGGHFTGHNSLMPPRVEEVQEGIEIHNVKTSTLDKFINQHALKKVDFIKLDVEGGELDVLSGGKYSLKNSIRPVILYEIQDIRTEPWGYPAKRIYELLNELDYQSFNISAQGELFPCPHSNTFDANLVAIPREKLGSLAHLMMDKRSSVPC